MKPAFVPFGQNNLEKRLEWLYYCESVNNLTPGEETEIRMIERHLFGTSRYDEEREARTRR